jgi:putative aminopeptidase FrvX
MTSIYPNLFPHLDVPSRLGIVYDDGHPGENSMVKLPAIDQDYLRQTLIELLQIPSPTGFTDAAIAYIQEQLKELGLSARSTAKGTLVATWEGEVSNKPRALTAHVDTLGAMVKEIKANGRLKLTQIGSYSWNTIEGEGCTVHTHNDELRGSVLLIKASGHVHGEQVAKTERSEETLEVRLDQRTQTREQTENLGVQVGDFVALDPRVETGDSGFIRSRHLDDKAGVVAILGALKAMIDEGLQPKQTTTLHFSNYEEVGHGAAAGFPQDLLELVAVDMAAVGSGQESDEYSVTICVKDSWGPYHFKLNQHLRALAKSNKIPHKVDIYPYYGSDGEAYWRAGGDVRVALIGPGVDASHNYERTHLDAVVASSQLICAYLQS